MPLETSIQAATRPAEGAEPAPRVDAILGLARQAFVEKGFDGASMKDLARAAGMSAGNFYRYFPSKSAIVEALVARDLAEVEDAFRAIVASPDPLSALKSALRFEMGRHCDGEDNLLWAEITAAATRKPEIAAILAHMEEGIAHRVAQVMGLAAGLAEEEALVRFDLHSRLIFLIMHGAMTAQMARTQPRDGVLTELVLRTIDRVMDDAVAETKDP